MGSGWAAMGGADASEKVVMDAAVQLLAVEDIKRLKARYFRWHCCIERELAWDRWGSCLGRE
jgi:hypothetical protein